MPETVLGLLLVVAFLVCAACFVLSLVKAAFSIPAWVHWGILALIVGVLFFTLGVR
jgi:hypothetical protein